jgi:hypothetical protein
MKETNLETIGFHQQIDKLLYPSNSLTPLIIRKLPPLPERLEGNGTQKKKQFPKKSLLGVVDAEYCI